ncbi:MAG TPA: type 1 glutamine amidotransferase family protein [Amycolatopsis sp.]|uniref:type 1 glutamine amidotransferase family protein n=1 Tax=Amycolatopsis sp. TaxID=37632 RepID=UPI002B488583|nr:type 1 glutamine amidotransferase family protein [Amycolatopsis sp.]HKS44097.1 type 1 glutamine amidotransferase family protein [Amycolatopsis sp.]
MTGKTAYLYVLDTLADWEPGFLTAELNSGRYFARPDTRIPVRTAGLTTEPVTTMGGLRVRPEVPIDEIRPQDAAILILPGGNTWLEPLHDPVPAKAAEFLAAGVPVAAICGATLALANAGMLDERRHTSNNLGALRAMCHGYAGAGHFVPEPAVTDGDLITASGSAPLEFAREALARLGVLAPASLEAWYRLHAKPAEGMPTSS